MQGPPLHELHMHIILFTLFFFNYDFHILLVKNALTNFKEMTRPLKSIFGFSVLNCHCTYVIKYFM